MNDTRVRDVYDELRLVAKRYCRYQPPNFTLSPTEIVHEACIQLMESGPAHWTSTGHLRAIAICKIWQVIVDHLKRRGAQKRGGNGAHQVDGRLPGETDGQDASGPARMRRIPLESVTVDWCERQVDLLDLAEAMMELSGTSRRLCDVVTLHSFGGLTHAEVGQELGISASTAEKDFRYGLAWLNRRLQRGNVNGH